MEKSAPFAKSRSYLYRLGWGIIIGLICGVLALAFVGIMNLGLEWLWPSDQDYDAFSGEWRILGILAAAGLIVGLIHHFLNPKHVDVFFALEKGRLDPKSVPASMLVAQVSLIGGFALGPEVPLGMLAGGTATKISEYRKEDEETQRTNMLSGIMSSYSGLFSAVWAVLLIPVELTHRQGRAYYGPLMIGATAGLIGFAIFWVANAEEFSGMLRMLDLPEFELELWHIAMGVVFGVLGAALGLIFGIMMRLLKTLVTPLNSRPIIRCTLAGVLLGLLGVALPGTLFLGTDGLVVVTTEQEELGRTLITVMIFAKMLALSGALSTGFIGGPVFPLFFIGGTAGTLVNMYFEDIPLALCVGCLMAAVPAALTPIPLALGALTMLIAGIPAEEAIPIFVASLVAFVITHGVLGMPPEESE